MPSMPAVEGKDMNAAYSDNDAHTFHASVSFGSINAILTSSSWKTFEGNN